MIAPSATPTPIPALAPLERPDGGFGDGVGELVPVEAALDVLDVDATLDEVVLAAVKAT